MARLACGEKSVGENLRLGRAQGLPPWNCGPLMT